MSEVEPQEIDENFIPVEIDIEIYLRYREDPLPVRSKYYIHKNMLGPEDGETEISDEDIIARIMNFTSSMILQILDTKSEHRILFTDSKFNKRIFLVDEIQSFSLLAPDKVPYADS